MSIPLPSSEIVLDRTRAHDARSEPKRDSSNGTPHSSQVLNAELADPNVTARRLGRATLGYLIAVTLVITLSPFGFRNATVHGFTRIWTWSDLVMNIVMFAPLGFLLQLTRSRTANARWWESLVFGVVFSTAIEVTQLFAPTRFSSLYDIATNTAGAGIGALAFSLIAQRIQVRASHVRNLALELPLMGLVYLLIPLVWLIGLAANGSDRGWLMLLVAAFGGAIIGAVHGGFLEPGGRVGRWGLLLASGVWFGVAAMPGAMRDPQLLVGGLVVTLGSAWLRSVATGRQRALGGNRRFELPTLRLAMPLFAAYLGFSSLWPLTNAIPVWTGGFEFFPVGGAITMTRVFMALEYVAAFTLVGYIIAEFYGRAGAAYSSVVWRVLRRGVVLVGLLEFARGWHADIGASALMAMFALSASVFGGWIYHLQRDHVLALSGQAKRSAS